MLRPPRWPHQHPADLHITAGLPGDPLSPFVRDARATPTLSGRAIYFHVSAALVPHWRLSATLPTPRLPDEDLKKLHIHVRVTEKEQRKILKAARSVNAKPATWARDQLLAAADAVIAARQVARLEQLERAKRIKELEDEVSAENSM